MLIIAERINASRRGIRPAIESRDTALIQEEVRRQAAAGAGYIDLNAGTLPADQEAGGLFWLVETAQAVCDLPLCLDSPNPETLAAAAPLCRQPPLINSITLESQRFDGIVPLLAGSEMPVIALCQDEGRMAVTTADKIELAGRLIARLGAAGIGPERIYIDPLVYPLATDPESAAAALDAIAAIMVRFAGVHTVCGLTNVSYGLPARRLVNRTFLVAAICRGLDAVICDPTDVELVQALHAARLVAGRDAFCMDFIQAFKEGRLG